MITIRTAAERPDLWKISNDAPAVWPEYNMHGDDLNRWWGLLDEELPQFQFVLYDDEAGSVAARGLTGPLAWNGQDEALPGSIDQAIEQIFTQHRSHAPVSALCALAAEISPDARGRGLAAEVLASMRNVAQHNGLRHLIAPVRPSWKHRYPLTPIENYVRWRRPDGQLLDPWMRTHERLGARVATPLPRSLRITGTVADWESWTDLAFPESGDYVFPEGLATVHIDRAADRGTYWEPNVWLIHPDIET
jgi:GNAT superfamily N-acetyltransferase